MPLHLTDEQVRQVGKLQRLLIAPLRFRTPGDWIDALHEAVTGFLGLERSLVVLPRAPGDVLVHAPAMERNVLARLDSALIGAGRRVNRYSDPMLDRAMHRLAAAGVEVWTDAIAARVSRIPLVAMPRFYPEVVEPARLEGMIMMGAPLEHGRAMMGAITDEPEEDALPESVEHMFRLLLPAFRAGSRAHAVSVGRWRRVEAILDHLDQAAAVFRGGVERYRNPPLRRLLAEEEAREELAAAIARCAERMSVSLRPPRGSTTVDDVSTRVVTRYNRYRIAATHLAGTTAAEPLTVMVTVRPAIPPLPDEAALRERYGLTARQAEVARLLARGLSNREVGSRLGTSPHTARHHAQRVLEKVGAPSRKALALHLLAGRNGPTDTRD